MGVDRNDYIVYGWKLPYDLKNSRGEKIDIWDDKFLPMIEGWPGVEYTMIIDGMSGKYIVFGFMIDKCDDYHGWDFVELKFKDLNSSVVTAKFEQVFDMVPETNPKLFVFSHYS